MHEQKLLSSTRNGTRVNGMPYVRVGLNSKYGKSIEPRLRQSRLDMLARLQGVLRYEWLRL